MLLSLYITTKQLKTELIILLMFLMKSELEPGVSYYKLGHFLGCEHMFEVH